MNFHVDPSLLKPHLLLQTNEISNLIKDLPLSKVNTSRKRNLSCKDDYNEYTDYVKYYFGIYFSTPYDFNISEIPKDIVDTIKCISNKNFDLQFLNENIDRYIELYGDIEFKLQFLKRAIDATPYKKQNRHYYISKNLDNIYKNVSNDDKIYILHLCLLYAYTLR